MKRMMLIGLFSLLALLMYAGCTGGGISSGDGNGGEPNWPGNPTDEEKGVLEATNDIRTSNLLSKLEWCNGLANCARAHAYDMCDRQFFDHQNPDGDWPDNRAKKGKAGKFTFDPIIPPYQWIGENIAYGYPDIDSVMAGWMSSPGHRANILDPNWTYLGVGYCACEGGTKYYRLWVQNFGTR